MGVAAGLALGLGSVIAVEASTGEAAAQRSFTITSLQFKHVQKTAQAGVGRANTANKRAAVLESKVPLWIVSTGGPGSNMVRSQGGVSAQRVAEGNYRVRFVKNISACSWAGTIANDAAGIPGALTIRLALDTTDAARTQLIVRTDNPNKPDTPADAPFQVQVFC